MQPYCDDATTVVNLADTIYQFYVVVVLTTISAGLVSHIDLLVLISHQQIVEHSSLMQVS